MTLENRNLFETPCAYDAILDQFNKPTIEQHLKPFELHKAFPSFQRMQSPILLLPMEA